MNSTTRWQHVNSHDRLERTTNKNTEAANIHTDKLTFTLSREFPFKQELKVLKTTTNYHTERHTSTHKPQTATSYHTELLSEVLRDALCVAAGGGFTVSPEA